VSGQLEVARILGAGPHGTVYEAVDVGDGTAVALKVLDPGLEVDVVGRLQRTAAHPAFVVVDTVDRLEDDCVCLRMELVRGMDVASLLAEAPFPARHALGIVRQTLLAVRALHAVGLVHGDLKPENVMLAGIGVVDDELADIEAPVRILDAGIRSVVARDVTGGAAGSASAYLAPEIARTGTMTAAGDLFAIGVILVDMICEGPAAIGARWTDELGFLTWKALQPDPRDRFRNATEMIAAVEVALRSLSTERCRT
jgi:serine/threonine-protein kinase